MNIIKKIAVLLVFSLVLTSLGGCNSNTEDVKKDNSKLQVYTSFYCVYDFVSKIGGDKVQVYNMVPTGTEPHNWEPTSGDMLKLSNADFLFYNGGGMENWVEDVKAAIENPKIKYVELSSNIELLKSTHNHEHESHDHEKETSHDHEEEHNHEEGLDPHIWFDPQNAKKEAFAIKEAFVSADSQNADYYNKNYDEFAKKIDKLDSDFKNAVQKAKNKTIVVAHEAYGYLCKAYGLQQLGIEGINAESEPSPAKMTEISKFVKDNNVKYIFFEELLATKAVSVISEETGAELLVLNPFEGLKQEDIDKGEDYFSVMTKNLENIKKALQV